MKTLSLLLMGVLLFSCTPDSSLYDFKTSQNPPSPKRNDTVTVYTSYQIPERLRFTYYTLTSNAPTTRTELLNGYTIKGFVCGQCYGWLPYANAVPFDGKTPKSSDPAEYLLPKEAQMISPKVNAQGVPDLMDVNFDAMTNQLSSSYTLKVLDDGSGVPPNSGGGYGVNVETGFVIFPKGVEAIPANWAKAFVIARSTFAAIRVEY